MQYLELQCSLLWYCYKEIVISEYIQVSDNDCNWPNRGIFHNLS
jgi:hypothetical protein